MRLHAASEDVTIVATVPVVVLVSLFPVAAGEGEAPVCRSLGEA